MSSSPVLSVARAAGSALGGVFGGLAALRRTKPLHPSGSVVGAVLERTGAPSSWGVPWLDEPGSHDATVRLPRSVGLPAGWPDVLGLAVRFRTATPHDLLLASTGSRPGLRHLMAPHRDPATAFYGSLLPYATPRGQALLAARPEADGAFGLVVATFGGEWERFGSMRLTDTSYDGADALIDLDPVLHPLPGLPMTRLVAALREPSYAAARRFRPDTVS